MGAACFGAVVIATGLGVSACRRPPEPGPGAIRLVERFDAKLVEGSPSGKAVAAIPRTEWRFDGPAAPGGMTPGSTAGGAGAHPAVGGAGGRPAGGGAAAAQPGAGKPAAVPATRGWEAGPGVTGLAIRDGLLVGRSTTESPILHVERTSGLENADQLQAVEIRMRVSAGANLHMVTRPTPTADLKAEAALPRVLPGAITTPVIAGGELQTYTMTPPAPVTGARIRHIVIRPTDAKGADFAIESVRLVFRREHLAAVPSGASWQGLRDIFRETLVTRSPETARFELTLPSRPLLDLALGTPEEGPVTFHATIRRDGKDAAVMTHTVTTAYRWEPRVVDLHEFAGEEVSLTLSATAEKPGTIAFWGAPAVRQRVARDAGGPPQTVILIQGDTLRKDHLELYGYARPTGPTLKRLAEEGAFFDNAITQTSWTKAATPSIHTSLYPSTHGVHQIPDRLPSSATTIAEVYRDAGYATVSFAAVAFTGAYTNLHQGFEVVHEGESTAGRAGPRGAKTAREFTDRLVEWLDGHRDIPVFVYLHFFDPHPPYEPNRPYDTLWADPKGREEYLREQEALKKFVADPFLAQRGMATPEELVKAGLDPAWFLQYSKDWYDGSIRGMDDEIARLVERLRGLGLDGRSVIAFYADHGEEFHDHGRMWHGQSLYGELIRVPLILWGPGRVPRGTRIEEPVELIDIMPTLLELSGLRVPEAAQGQSLRPLLAGPPRGDAVSAGGGWKKRPIIAEKQPIGREAFPNLSESYAIMDGGWKLIQNVARPPEKPEFELFDFYKDPLDQTDVAAAHPDVVARLAKGLDGFRTMAKAARLKPDSESTRGMSKEQLEQLRALGYVK
jgi:arylsulfatase A-like enzyme